jgi:DNA polymerase-3 subunit delta'
MTAFDDIIGQGPAVGIFRNALESKRLGHTYLFAGPEGVGKLHFAIALARLLMCDRHTGCGQCRACRWIDQQAHPNFRIIDVPEGKQSIPIDAVRQVEQEMALKPFVPGYRIFVFNNADRMEEEAGNALLKSLEEPTRDCIMILITAHPESILPTVISRCQIVRFYPIRQEILEPFFVSRLKISQADARLLAYLSDGSIGYGIRIHSGSLLKQREWLIDNLHLASSFRETAEGVLGYAKSGKVSRETERERIIQQFKAIGLFLRDVLLAHHIVRLPVKLQPTIPGSPSAVSDKGALQPRIPGSKSFLQLPEYNSLRSNCQSINLAAVINQDKIADIKQWLKRTKPESVQRAIEELLAAEQYIRLNVNVNLVTESLFLNINRLLKKVSPN